MMQDCPQRRASSSPRVRATMSTAPPAGKGTSRCTGFDGKASCADAAPADARSGATSTASRRNDPAMVRHPMAVLPFGFSPFKPIPGRLTIGPENENPAIRGGARERRVGGARRWARQNLGRASGRDLHFVLGGFAQHIAAAPHGLDVVLAARRIGELLAQLADEDVDDLELGIFHAAQAMHEKN